MYLLLNDSTELPIELPFKDRYMLFDDPNKAAKALVKAGFSQMFETIDRRRLEAMPVGEMLIYFCGDLKLRLMRVEFQ